MATVCVSINYCINLFPRLKKNINSRPFGLWFRIRPQLSAEFLDWPWSRWEADGAGTRSVAPRSPSEWHGSSGTQSWRIPCHLLLNFTPRQVSNWIFWVQRKYSQAELFRVKHLILADPWGFPERPGDTLSNKVSLPYWVKAIAFVVSPLNPLWAVRASGPLGKSFLCFYYRYTRWQTFELL